MTATGGTLGTQWSNLVTGSSVEFAGGLVFGAGGEEFNPATGLLLGSFDVGNTCCNNMQVLPNSAINRAFALGQTPLFNGFGITSYNLAQFTPLAAVNLSGILPNPGSNNSSISNFIQWGPNGLACILGANPCCGAPTTQVILLQSPTLLMNRIIDGEPGPGSKYSEPHFGHARHGKFPDDTAWNRLRTRFDGDVKREEVLVKLRELETDDRLCAEGRSGGARARQRWR